MKVITISGRAGSGKSTRAETLYKEHMRAGRSVAMHDDDSYGVYFSDVRARSNPDVKIVTKMTNSDLQETTT